MDLVDHLRTMWHNKWRILAFTAVVVAVVFARSSSLDPVYESETRLAVIPADPATDRTTVQFIAAGFTELIGTDVLVDRAISNSGLEITRQQARRRLSFATSEDTAYIGIGAFGPTPEDARALAQGAADALVAQVEAQQLGALEVSLAPLDAEIEAVEDALAALERGSGEEAEALRLQLEALADRRAQLLGAARPSAEVIQEAAVQPDPVAPTPERDAAVAFVVGAVVISQLVVAAGAISGRFGPDTSGAKIVDAVGLPVLARVPAGAATQRREAFRGLRTNLILMADGGTVVGVRLDDLKLRTIAVVSAEPGGGRSTVAAGLALAVAEVGAEVVTVDTDLRDPGLHRMLGVDRAPGLAEVPPGGDLSKVAQSVLGVPNLRVVAAGYPVNDPAGQLVRLVPSLALLDAEMVVVDAPPPAAPESAAVAAQCDAVLVVVDVATRRQALMDLVKDLTTLGARPIGVVLNRMQLQ